jgi:hypothetical protein
LEDLAQLLEQNAHDNHWHGRRRTFLTLRLNISPFPDLLLLPQEFFSFLMRCPIAPKEEVNLKTFTNKTLEFVNHKAHCLAGNRKMKVTITLELDIKIRS